MTKTFLITGATDGVGRITARLLAEQGHEVLLHGRTETRVADVADAIRREIASDSIRGYHADLGRLDEVRALADRVRRIIQASMASSITRA